MHLGFPKDVLEKIEQCTKVTGVIKKKREKALIGNASSDEKWFCFRGMGRFLTHYFEKKKPVEVKSFPGDK